MIASPVGNNRLPFPPTAGSSSNGGGGVSTSAAVIKVVVNAMADISVPVREAAAATLQENANRHAMTILEYCKASLRTGKRRPGSHHAGVLRVMAHVVREMSDADVDEMSLRSLVKIGMGEMLNIKELMTEWQLGGSALLVALAARMPKLVMDEVFLQFSSSNVPVVAIVRTLADFAAENALLFVPYLKDVLSRVLPVLGGVKDAQRQIFATAFMLWCQGLTQYYLNVPRAPAIDSDTQALIESAFELFLSTWILSREPKVRLKTVEALGEMSALIGRPQLKAALPKLIPAILNVYKKEKDDPLPITEGLYMALEAALGSDSTQPLFDFQSAQVVLSAILPMANASSETACSIDVATFLRNKYAVLRCCERTGRVFPEDILNYLLQRIGAKDDPVKLGAFAALNHLTTRLQEQWEGKKTAIVEAVKNVLHESDLSLRKAIVQLIVSMASAGYLTKENGEPFIEFLVRQCAISDTEVEQFKQRQSTDEKAGVVRSSGLLKSDLRVGVVSPSELRAVCDKSLHLLASTIPEMEPLLWPFLLGMLLPEAYTGAVATVCKCISDLVKRKLARGEGISLDVLGTSNEFPSPQVLLARMLVLLHNPMAREQLVQRLLGVLYLLAPLFHPTVASLWKDEIPKMLAYVSDKDESWQQALWDDMVLHFLSETVDVIHDQQYCMSLGDAFGEQYDLYADDHQHSALLHRCLGLVLGKIEDKPYVKDKIDLMYKRADVSVESHRDGLAMGLGMVATTHLDTVLAMLRRVLETQGNRRMRRLLSYFFEQKKNVPNADDVCAAVALMYGYAAWYAPSSAIEARIETLVGSNMLAGLLGVKTAKPRQAVISAIDLLGKAVIKAARYGVAFQLRRRDEMLNHVMMFMSGTSPSQPYPQTNPTDIEFLNTQRIALSACTTLVSVQPKLSNSMRDRLLQATIHFFTLQIEPSGVVMALTENLKMLLKALLRTGGDDGKSRSDLLLLLLQQIDQYVCSPVYTQRERATSAVLELLRQFHTLCTTGSEASVMETPVPEGLSPLSHLTFSKGLSAWPALTSNDRGQSSMGSGSGGSSSAATPLLPERHALKFGQRLMAYLPRCTDPSPLVRENAIQIIEVLFRIALLLPKSVGVVRREDKEAIYAAQSMLQQLALSRSEWLHALSTEEQQDMLKKIASAVSKLITTKELVSFLRISEKGVCDRTETAAKGAIIAITDLIRYRGAEISDTDLPRITDQFLVAAAALSDYTERQSILLAVCELAEQAKSRVVFDELLNPSAGPGKKEGSKKRDPGLVEDAFRALAAHEVLGLELLEHVVDVLNQSPIYVDEDQDKQPPSQYSPTHQREMYGPPQAATLAMGAIFRVGGGVREKVVEPRYAKVLCALILRIGSVLETLHVNMQPAKELVATFRAFCDCVGDEEMKQILSDLEQKFIDDEWIEVVAKIAGSTGWRRPHLVNEICTLLWPALKRSQDYQRAAAAAALSEYVKHNVGEKLLGQLVGALSAHIGDEEAIVRKRCVTGLAEVPSSEMPKYASQVLSVVAAVIEDCVEDVAFTAVRELSKILELVTEETVSPMLLSLCVRLRALQNQENVGIRAAAFSAFGVLSKFGAGPHREGFLEQVHITLPRLLFHVNDEAMDVRHACKNALRRLAPLLRSTEISEILNSRAFDSDRRAIVHASDHWEVWNDGVMVHAMIDITDFLLNDAVLLPHQTVRNLLYVEDHSSGTVV
ncbi:hypothetical protein CBR_g53950, partial [Chara braunii]